MRRFDFSPLYRQTIGFEHLANLIEQLASTEGDNGFPPYNLERLGENEYRITMAVAGFSNDDLTIEVKEGTLTVRGEKTADAAEH
jgi:molecular chaperone IbpA